MKNDNQTNLEKTQELYDFLQGNIPENIRTDNPPTLTAEQAWTVIWFLGNQYWQVPDCIEKCDVCDSLYHTWEEGECMDYGKPPFFFCGSCMDTDEAVTKRRIGTRLERARIAMRKRSNDLRQARAAQDVDDTTG